MEQLGKSGRNISLGAGQMSSRAHCLMCSISRRRTTKQKKQAEAALQKDSDGNATGSGGSGGSGGGSGMQSASVDDLEQKAEENDFMLSLMGLATQKQVLNPVFVEQMCKVLPDGDDRHHALCQLNEVSVDGGPQHPRIPRTRTCGERGYCKLADQRIYESCAILERVFNQLFLSTSTFRQQHGNQQLWNGGSFLLVRVAGSRPAKRARGADGNAAATELWRCSFAIWIGAAAPRDHEVYLVHNVCERDLKNERPTLHLDSGEHILVEPMEYKVGGCQIGAYYRTGQFVRLLLRGIEAKGPMATSIGVYGTQIIKATWASTTLEISNKVMEFQRPNAGCFWSCPMYPHKTAVERKKPGQADSALASDLDELTRSTVVADCFCIKLSVSDHFTIQSHAICGCCCAHPCRAWFACTCQDGPCN